MKKGQMKINFKYLYLILLSLYFIYFSQFLNPYLFALGLIWIFYSFLITSNSIKFSAFGKSFLLELTKKGRKKYSTICFSSHSSSHISFHFQEKLR